jgi:high-affinity Fe2+/Pb2+ permease
MDVRGGRGNMGDFQVLYGFCVVFIASMLMMVAYWEGFGEHDNYYDKDERVTHKED